MEEQKQAPNFESISKELKALADIIHSHDKLLSSDNMKALTEMIEEYKKINIVHKSDKERAEKIVYYGKIVVFLASFLTASGYIYREIINHIK